jgi:hypothetical protein
MCTMSRLHITTFNNTDTNTENTKVVNALMIENTTLSQADI